MSVGSSGRQRSAGVRWLRLASWLAIAAAIVAPAMAYADWDGPFWPLNNLQQVVCFSDGSAAVGYHIECKETEGVSCSIDSETHANCQGSRLGAVECNISGRDTACAAVAPDTTCEDAWWIEWFGQGCWEAGPGLRASTALLSFQGTFIGDRSADNTFTLNVVPDGSGSLSVVGVTATGDFSIASENCTGNPALTSCTVAVTFGPTAAGRRDGLVVVETDAATGSLSVPLTGMGEGIPRRSFLIDSNLTQAIAEARVGESGTGTISFHNDGNSTGSYTLTFDNKEFTVVADSCGGQLRAWEYCQATVQFLPAGDGLMDANLLVDGDFDNLPMSAVVRGNALPARIRLSASAATLDFGSVFGGTISRTLALFNDGELPVTTSDIALSGATTVFAADSTACITTLAPGESCSLGVAYSPSDYGSSMASLVVTSSAIQSPLTISLLGRLLHEATTVSVAQNRLLVGRVPAGASSAGSTVTLTNTGTNPLYVGQVPSGEPYSVALGSCASPVAPGAQCTLTLYARPAIGGVFTMVAHIPVNTTDLSVPITLVGFGDAPVCP